MVLLIKYCVALVYSFSLQRQKVYFFLIIKKKLGEKICWNLHSYLHGGIDVLPSIISGNSMVWNIFKAGEKYNILEIYNYIYIFYALCPSRYFWYQLGRAWRCRRGSRASAPHTSEVSQPTQHHQQ